MEFPRRVKSGVFLQDPNPRFGSCVVKIYRFLETCDMYVFCFTPKTCKGRREQGGGRVKNHYLPPRIMEVKNGPIAKGNHSSLEIQTVSTSVTIGEEECTPKLVGNSGLVRSNATVCLVSLGPLGVFPPVMYTLSSFSGEFPNYGHSGVSHYFGKTPHYLQ